MLEQHLKMIEKFTPLAGGYRFKLLRKAFAIDQVAQPKPLRLIQQPGVKITRFINSCNSGSNSWRL